MKRDERARISHACHMRPGPGGVPLCKVKDVSEANTRGWTQDFFCNSSISLYFSS